MSTPIRPSVIMEKPSHFQYSPRMIQNAHGHYFCAWTSNNHFVMTGGPNVSALLEFVESLNRNPHGKMKVPGYITHIWEETF